MKPFPVLTVIICKEDIQMADVSIIAGTFIILLIMALKKSKFYN